MSKTAFQVGQRVNFKFGTRDVQGTVKEDRGPIGMKGRVQYRIEFRFDAESPDLSYIELPADKLEKVESPTDPFLTMPQLAELLSKNDPTVSGDLLSRLRNEMGLNRADFARMVGLSERSVATWEGGADLKESSLRTIVEIGRLYAKLRQSFAPPEQLATWLKTPNAAFGGSQPLQVIERGEIDRIWRMIYFLESGSPSCAIGFVRAFSVHPTIS